MPTIDYNNNKQVIAELDLLLLEMWFLSNLKNKKIKFNPEPILNFFNVSNKQPTPKEEKFVDLHFEIAKKVDALIAKYESELKTGEPEMISKIHQDIPIPNIIENREPSIIRQPEIPVFNAGNFQNISFGEFKQEEELFEIVEPPEFIPVEDKPQDDVETSESFMLDDQDKSDFKIFSALGRIKVRNNEKTSKQKTVKTEKPKKQTVKSETTKTKFNDLSIKKDELEKTRQEIEAKRQALKKAKEKEKAKKLELKKQKVEKKKEEKLKKLELKRLEKEKKIQELKKQKEEKQKQIEREKEEKLKQIEREKQEKLKAKKIKEKEIAAKQKVDEKEEKPVKEKKVKINIKKETPVGMDNFVRRRQEIKEQYDRDVEKLIPIIDGLLEKLPDDIIDNFAQSKDFVLYEKVVSKYKHM